ncbi:MAG: type I DNA topoisomerase [Chloroflexota bacterium]
MPPRTSAKGKSRVARATGRKAATPKGVSRARSSLGKHLVIVESPAKARTIGQILGAQYLVTASQGHVRDLPRSKIGVDVEQDFQPSYMVIEAKRTILDTLKKAGTTAASIYLATDPDREGEAISWHLQAAAQWDQRPDPPKRVVFHEITKEAVLQAFQHPREIDMQLVGAQQARRILDRLVGYQISPLLWKRVQRGLSAGRVQSVTLRMLVDREREIASFVPVESWTLESQLRKETDPADRTEPFTAVLHSAKGQKGRLTIATEAEASHYQAELKDAAYSVAEVRKREVRQRPAAPFTTSTMQQEAGSKLRFTARQTMVVAQQLYEGLPVGDEGPVGLITYMRTDSTQVATVAVQEARQYIRQLFGPEYLPEKPRAYKTRSKAAQEAHEAIRPTALQRHPDSLKAYLTPNQLNLYTLIWRRMLASQMADARTEATTVDIDATSSSPGQAYLFRATGSVMKFPGFRTLYLESQDDGDEDGNRKPLPALADGDLLACLGLEAVQHFTQPPPRYSEATLIRAMEEKGIGRPSTYAPTISTLLDRHYAEKEQNRLVPTTLGTTITDLLTQFFADVMNLDFTARMEEELDQVSRGEREWVPMLQEFYGPFQKALAAADADMPRVKLEEKTDEVCDSCGRPMVIKTGRFGRFLACTGFPECKHTRPILKKTGAVCPKCGGHVVERRSRGKGRSFYGCSQYPACDFISMRRPVAVPCPECGGMMVVAGRDNAACTVCVWQGPLPQQEEELVSTGD